MPTLRDVAAGINKPTDEVLRHLYDACKEFGEEGMILGYGVGDTDSAILSDLAVQRIHRRVRDEKRCMPHGTDR